MLTRSVSTTPVLLFSLRIKEKNTGELRAKIICVTQLYHASVTRGSGFDGACVANSKKDGELRNAGGPIKEYLVI